jgi:hypothetical protein
MIDLINQRQLEMQSRSIGFAGRHFAKAAHSGHFGRLDYKQAQPEQYPGQNDDKKDPKEDPKEDQKKDQNQPPKDKKDNTGKKDNPPPNDKKEEEGNTSKLPKKAMDKILDKLLKQEEETKKKIRSTKGNEGEATSGKDW